MASKRTASHTTLKPDPVYNSVLVTQMINQYRAPMAAIFNIRLQSARLASTQSPVPSPLYSLPSPPLFR